jgi:hypothetical protein
MLFDDAEGRFDSEPVSNSELDEERQRTSENMLEWQILDEKQLAASWRRRNTRETGIPSRRPKAGKYPVGYSSYSMSAKRGLSIARLLIKNDLKVIFCAVIFFLSMHYMCLCERTSTAST